MVGALSLNMRDFVSLVGRGGSVVGALSLNIRDFVSLVGRGGSVVGTPLRNLDKFVYPTLRWSLLCGVYAMGSKISHTRGNMCNLSWTPYCSLEKDTSLNNSCVSPRMGCLVYTNNN